MAKKGGVQQLQTEINTNEELMKFLEKDGLLSENLQFELWKFFCAMVSSTEVVKFVLIRAQIPVP